MPRFLETLASGRFRVRIRVPGKPRYNSRPFATEAEAAAHRDAVLVELLSTPATAVGGTVTFRRWWGTWAARREADPSHRSSTTDRSFFDVHFGRAPWADWPLAHITRRVLRDWVRGLLATQARAARWTPQGTRRRGLGRTLAASSVDRMIATLRACFEAAVDDELLVVNPARRVKIKQPPRTKDTWTFLTEAEIARATASPALPPWAQDLHTVLIYQGLRKGEAFGLREEDVCVEPGRAEIVVRYSHRGPTKAGKPRTIPLLEPARLALVRRLQDAPSNPDGLLFPTRTGERRSRTDDAQWTEHRKACGITRHVRLHDLRHTAASHLLMGTWGRRWTLEEVRDYLGHSSSKTTERYAHLSPDHLRATAAATATATTNKGGGGRGPGSGPGREVTARADSTRMLRHGEDQFPRHGGGRGAGRRGMGKRLVHHGVSLLGIRPRFTTRLLARCVGSVAAPGHCQRGASPRARDLATLRGRPGGGWRRRRHRPTCGIVRVYGLRRCETPWQHPRPAAPRTRSPSASAEVIDE